MPRALLLVCLMKLNLYIIRKNDDFYYTYRHFAPHRSTGWLFFTFFWCSLLYHFVKNRQGIHLCPILYKHAAKLNQELLHDHAEPFPVLSIILSLCGLSPPSLPLCVCLFIHAWTCMCVCIQRLMSGATLQLNSTSLLRCGLSLKIKLTN